MLIAWIINDFNKIHLNLTQTVTPKHPFTFKDSLSTRKQNKVSFKTYQET